MTDLSNVTPFRPKDPGAAERKRRSRAKAKQRKRRVTPVTKPVTMTADGGHGESHIQATDSSQQGVAAALKSSAIRDAAKAAGQVSQVVEFPVTRRDTEVTEEAVTNAPTTPAGSRIIPDLATQSFRLSDSLTYLVACGLAGIAGWFSLKGLAVLFPGAPTEIVVMGALMECAKIIGAGWLAGHWRHVPWAFRGVLALLIAGLMLINAAGLFSQLTAAHVGDRTLTAAAVGMEGVEYDARIEMAAAKLADVDRRLGGLDAIVAGAAQKGRARTASNILEEQTKTRAGLVAERKRAAEELADLKVKRGAVQARAAIVEQEAMPLRYAAELLGMGTDDEKAIRLLIALMVLCCDPLAIALTAAVSARRSIVA